MRPRTLWLVSFMAMAVLAGCTSSPPAALDDEATAVSSWTQTASPSSSTVGSTTSAAPVCDHVARGSAGVPTEADEPVLVVRYSSYWGYSRRYAPALVVYRSGAVAVARFGGNDGSDNRSGDGTPSPFRSYLGGRFSQCAVDALLTEFDELDHADLGESGVYDCTEIEVQKFTPGTGALSGEIYLNGFGCEGALRERELRTMTDEQRQQRAARDRLVDWVEGVGNLEAGHGLPMDAVIVVGSGHWYPAPAANKKLTKWTAGTLDRERGCTLFRGRAASDALSQVRTAIEANPGVRHDSYVYTATWLVAGRQTRLGVMLTAPAMTCALGE